MCNAYNVDNNDKLLKLGISPTKYSYGLCTCGLKQSAKANIDNIYAKCVVLKKDNLSKFNKE